MPRLDNAPNGLGELACKWLDQIWQNASSATQSVILHFYYRPIMNGHYLCPIRAFYYLIRSSICIYLFGQLNQISFFLPVAYFEAVFKQS